MANWQLDKNSAAVRKQMEAHKFEGEDGEEYGASRFGEFGDYFRRKKMKLQNEDTIMRHTVPGKPQIFKDVVAHVASYTQPPPEEQLVLHGAQYIKYLDFKTMVTHIIASTLPPKKADEWRRLRVVKPAWVEDSIAAGKTLPWSDYRLINEGPGQRRIQFDNGKLAVQDGKSDQMASYREQSKNSYYSEQMQKFAAAKYGVPDPAPSTLFQELETLPPGEDEYPLNDDFVFLNASLGNDLFSTTAQKAKSSGAVDKAEEDVNDTYVKDPSDIDEGDIDVGVGGEAVAAEQSPSDKEPAPAKPLTSEEHNALLLSDPKIRQASAANPDFLQQFYAESRLHHLSTWKAELKSKMQQLAAEKGQRAVTPKKKRPPGARRYIMHVDFDSFFCAVSLKSASSYADKPAAVAHSMGSASEIASCNYPARNFGVKNGMWMRRALELCPDLKVLPYDFPGYEAASRLFYEAILDVGGVVQSVSVDEALVDITRIVLEKANSSGADVDDGGIWREQDAADKMAMGLREQIKSKTGCDVSVGIGGNILLAKVALRRAKPAGQHQIRPEDVLGVLGGLTVEQLPGVAYSIGGKLEDIGVKLVQDLRSVSKERLVAVLGPKTGERLHDYARGIDHAEVGDQPVRKSVSAEVNWGIRFVSQEEAEEFVMNLCRELERRLLHEQVRGRNLTMKILRRAIDAPLDPEKHLGHGRCDVFNKSVAFGVATHDAAVIGREAVSILRSYRFSPGDLRGLGVQLQKLEPIKAGALAAGDGSQKKLSFDSHRNVAAAVAEKPKTLRKSIFTTPIAPASTRAVVKVGGVERDKAGPVPPAFASTQFFMPANPDPSVLAELPPDIIRRLVGQPRDGDANDRQGLAGRSGQATSRDASPVKAESRVQSPASTVGGPRNESGTDELPPDIDPEVFEALPPDVRSEVLAEYRQSARRSSNSPTPSPRRAQRHTKRSVGQSPVRRGLWGTRGLAAAAAARERRHDAEANRVQARLFMPAPPPAEDSERLEELDPDVLAALPADMRAEVLEDYRRHQETLAPQGGQAAHAVRLEVPGVNSRGEGGSVADTVSIIAPHADRRHQMPTALVPQEAMLRFPPPPPKMSFRASSDAAATANEPALPVVLSLAGTKDMIKTWHSATRDEGPHEIDVDVLERYLVGVIVQECDMDKARQLVAWLEWLVEDASGSAGSEGPGQVNWQFALTRVKQAVQAAMRARGLGAMQF